VLLKLFPVLNETFTEVYLTKVRSVRKERFLSALLDIVSLKQVDFSAQVMFQ